MVLLISIKTLKDFYLVDDNLEDKYLLSNIVKGQDFIIRPLIGKDKYDELLEQIETDSLTGDNKYLLDLIEKPLAYYVMSEVVYSTAYKLKNKGLEEDVNASRFNELVRISKKYLIDSQHYEQLLGIHMNEICNKGQSTQIYKTGLYIG